MRRGSVILALLLGAVVLLVVRWRGGSTRDLAHHHHQVVANGPDVAPVCPWREPQRDLLALFPPATNYVLESRILSRLTVDIEKRIGRHMNVDDNPLRIHRVRHEGRMLGSVLLVRVKAEHGAIEIVTGVETNGTVRGVLIQSHREPERIANVIMGAPFLSSFQGKTAGLPLRLGEDLPSVPAAARATAQAIADGVRDQLIVLSFAELPLEMRESGLQNRP